MSGYNDNYTNTNYSSYYDSEDGFNRGKYNLGSMIYGIGRLATAVGLGVAAGGVLVGNLPVAVSGAIGVVVGLIAKNIGGTMMYDAISGS